MDIDRGCVQYRIVFYINEGINGKKYYLDSSYRDLRKSLEYISKHLSTTNSAVVAQTTVLENGKCICLQSKAYSFSLNKYFR